MIVSMLSCCAVSRFTRYELVMARRLINISTYAWCGAWMPGAGKTDDAKFHYAPVSGFGIRFSVRLTYLACACSAWFFLVRTGVSAFRCIGRFSLAFLVSLPRFIVVYMRVIFDLYIAAWCFVTFHTSTFRPINRQIHFLSPALSATLIIFALVVSHFAIVISNDDKHHDTSIDATTRAAPWPLSRPSQAVTRLYCHFNTCYPRTHFFLLLSYRRQRYASFAWRRSAAFL